jgi:hypothetical protein
MPGPGFVRKPIRFWMLLGALAVLGTWLAPGTAFGAGQFTTLESGFTQSLYGVQSVENLFGGVTFAPNGDPEVDNCSDFGGALYRFGHATTLPTTNGTASLHQDTALASNTGCGLAVDPNGFLYSNTSNGIVKLDPNTGDVVAGPYGPRGNALGIAVDPISGNLVYVASDASIAFVDPGFTTSGSFSTATSGDGFVDQIAFDPTGQYLFVSYDGGNSMIVLRRDGSHVQSIPLTVGHNPDGIAFHSASPQFVVTNNNDGTMTRFDFPSNDFSQAPSQTQFASGGFRGDHAQVGPDSCLYATQNGTRYDDGTTSGSNSLVRICPGFAPPPGVGRRLLAFGDSIAAGYGLGPSGPLTGGSSTNNPHAYPAVLARDLGLPDDNFAIEGATAGVGPVLPIGPLSAATGVLNQICVSVGSRVDSTKAPTGCVAPIAPVASLPRVITITAGGNDIGFASCFTDFFSEGLTPHNPCAPSRLASSLMTLTKNLSLDFSLIHGYYPTEPVILTGYYNPLGNRSGNLALPPQCQLVDAAALGRLFGPNPPATIRVHALINYVHDLIRTSNGPTPENIAADAYLSAVARITLSKLNATLANIAAREANTTFVPITIGGQGLCSASPLIFEPQVQATFDLHDPLSGDVADSIKFGLQNRCPGPQDPNEINHSGGDTIHGLPLGSTFTYAFTFRSNCIPHPTRAGQASLARQILPYAPK